MSWSAHLYGNGKSGSEGIEGLVQQLSKRIGILKKVTLMMKKPQLKSVIEGIFNSKLIYGIQLFCNTWGIAPQDETNRRYTAFTKDDLRRLQVLQNITLRLQTKLPRHTPTDQLLQASSNLSVHQLGALHTLTLTHKTINSQKPEYLASQLRGQDHGDEGPLSHRHQGKLQVRKCKNTITRSGLVYRSCKLWNMLPADLREESILPQFKVKVKAWVKMNIGQKPP